MPSEKTVTKCSETRRSTKPIMEKRRRARINNSLSELKNLILDALKKDNARHSKLEKADILEMTVKHLQNLQQQPSPLAAAAADPHAMSRFRAGFAECANHVNRFLSSQQLVDPALRQRLLNHLANCLTGMTQNPAPLPPVHVEVQQEKAGIQMGGVQLLPTRLPNGEIAFLLPATALYAPAPAAPLTPATSPLSSAASPVDLLASSGLLSPADSDRSSSSPPLLHHPRMPSHSPVSVISHTSVMPQSPQMPHSPVSMTGSPASPSLHSKAVWRPF